MVTTSQTPPQPFTLVIGDDPVYSLDTDRRRIGIGTRLPQRRLHLVTPDAVVARFESTGAASPQVEFRGSGGSGTLSYNSATGQWVLGTDLEATDSELAVDVLSVPDGGPTAARIAVGTGDDIKVYHTGTTGYFRNETGSLYFLAGAGGSIAAVQIASTGAVTCSKGITVNTTAASSALVVADGTGETSMAGALTVSASKPAGSQYVRIRNLDNTSGVSHAFQWITSGGTSAGDAWTRYEIEGSTSWSVGIDNSASDAFRINQNSVVDGTNNFLRITTTGQTTLNATGSLGAALLVLDQDDTDEPFINFDGSSAASAATNISTWTSGATLAGYVRVAINGTDAWIAYHTAPTS